MRSFLLRAIPTVALLGSSLIGVSAVHAISSDTAPSGPIAIYQTGTLPCTASTCHNYAPGYTQTPFQVYPGCDGYSRCPGH